VPSILGVGFSLWYGIIVVAYLAITEGYWGRKRLTSKVKTIRFYGNYFEVSGWKSRKQFTYQDISSLSKGLHKVTFFSEEEIRFRIRDELILFRFKNLVNRKLHTDLYTWASKKVPPSSLGKPASLFESASS
jgi:hypothetical protein